jgi:hypothetical protein
VTLGNGYGLEFNSVRKLDPDVTYNTDAEAASGGVAVDGIYYAGDKHERAISKGTAVIRIV